MPRLSSSDYLSKLCFLAWFGVVGFLFFQCGSVYQILHRQPIEIKNNCAYYDMTTGGFTWGQRPNVVDTNVMIETLNEAVKPRVKK